MQVVTMKAHYRLKSTSTLLAVAAVLAINVTGCAERQAFTRGSRADVARDFETAMTEYKTALDQDPRNNEYRLKYETARYNAAFEHYEAGRRALEKQDYMTAKAEFTRVLEIDPTHALAVQQLAKVDEILTKRSLNEPAPEIQYEQLRNETRTDPSPQAQLEPKNKGPFDTIRMTQDSRMEFETLANLAGLNVIFDPDFRGTRVQLELNNIDIYEALDILALQTRSFWKPVNKSTILVSPDNQTKRRDYEELVLKTIYLTNSVTATELTEAITTLRTLLNMRYLMSSTAMNAIIIRDTPDRISIAEKIIEDLDKAKPEVLVDATILEADRNTLRQLGLLPPQGTSLSFTGGTATTGTTSGTGTTGTTTTTTGTSVTLRDLPKLNSGSFSITIPPTVAQFLASSSRTKLLQNPHVRATDGKLASIRIGEQVPIASGSFQPAFVGATGTPVVNFQFVDVGVNLDITPRVLLNHEISMTVMVQVRALAGDRNVGGVTQPVLTNRQVQHEIRLAEGETNVLGGIITDTEATSLSGIPGLKNIPLLRYLFSQEQKTRDQTEIIIMLTPHILRMPNITATNMRGLYTGSETIPRLRASPNVPAIGSPAPTTPAAPAAATPAPAAPAGPAGQPPAVTPVPPGTPATPPNTQPQAQRQTNSTLSFVPAPVVLPPTGPATLNIVGNGQDFFAVDLTLSFEPGAVNIREVRDGGMLSRDGQIVAFVQRMETESGTLRISLERPPGAAPVSGNGNLVTLVLERGMRGGGSTIRVTDFRIRDPQQNVSIGRAAEVQVSAP
jgi:general secretion pathway protein D